MSEQTFEKILIAWINCIDVSPQITEIEELKDGLFYSNLMNEIKTECKDEIADDVCVTVINFLKQNYLDKGLYNKVRNFSDFTKEDLIIITALLLHYTCMLSVRDKFKRAMCEKLSSSDQIWIKDFLETFDNIKNYNDIISFHSKVPILNQENIANVTSPLNDYFQTPIRRNRTFEKDKRIKSLLTELELERTDKLELLDELKTEQNKVKLITLQLKEKTEEARKIRNDLYALQAKTPPQNNYTDLNDVRRRYDSQIESLEMYTAQLQDEVDKLQTSNIEVIHKLKKAEMEATEWREKYMTIESQMDTLQEQHNKQNVNLQSLQVECNELNALLEEYKVSMSPQDESSINCDSKDDVCNRLGCALTLAELEDVTKQRDETKEMLMEHLNKELELNIQLKENQTRLAVMTADCTQLRQDNDQLTNKLIKMNQLEINFDELNREFDKISKELHQSLTKNVNFEVDIDDLHLKLNDMELKLETKNQYCISVAEDLLHYKDRCDHLNIELAEKCDRYDELSRESELLQTKYATVVQDFNKRDFELNALTKTFNDMNADIETSLRNLRETIFDETSNTTSSKDNIGKLNELIRRIAEDKKAASCERKQFLNKIEELEAIGEKLEEEIVQLKNAQAIDAREKETLNCNIKFLDDHVKELQMDIDSRSQKINELEGIISNMQDTVNDVEKARSALEGETGELKQIVAKKDCELADMQTDQKQQMELLQTEINQLYLKMTSKDERVSELERALTLANGKLEMKNYEFHLLKKRTEQLNADNENFAAGLQKKVDVLTATISDIEQELTSKVEENKAMESMLNDQLQKYNELECDKEMLVREYDNLSEKLNLQLESLVAREVEVAEKNKAIQLYEHDVDKLKADVQRKNVDLKNLQELIAQHVTTIDMLRSNTQELSTSLQHSNATLAELQRENDVLKSVKQQLEEAGVQLQSEIVNLTDELNVKKSELQDVLNQLNDYKNTVTIELEDARKKLLDAKAELDRLNSERKRNASRHEKEIFALNEQIDRLMEEKTVAAARERDCVNDLERAKMEIVERFTQYTAALQTQQQIKQEYENHVRELTENLHDLLRKYNDLEERSTMQSLDSQRNIEALRKTNETLELQLANDKLAHEILFKEMENQLNAKLDDSGDKRSALEEQVDVLRTELLAANLDKAKEIDVVTKLSTENSEWQSKHSALNDNYNQLLVESELEAKQHETESNRLKESLKLLQSEYDNLIEQRSRDEQKKSDAAAQIDALKCEICALKSQADRLLAEKNAEAEEYYSQVTALTENINSLHEESIYLNATRQKERDLINNKLAESKSTICEYEEKCTKLKAALDLLETCRTRLQTGCHKLTANCRRLTDEKEELQKLLDGTIQEKLSEMFQLTNELNSHRDANIAKDERISVLEANIGDLNRKLACKDAECVQHQDDWQREIDRLKSEFESKLATKRVQIDELKTLHNVTATDLINSKTENAEFKRQLDDYEQECESLRELFQAKESLIESLVKENEEQRLRIDRTARELADATARFDAKLQESKELENEKCKLQNELDKCTKDIERVRKNRDEVIDNQAKMIKETENNILRAHQNAIAVKNDLLKRVEMADDEIVKEKTLKQELETLLEQEKENKAALSARVAALECEKNRLIGVFKLLSHNLNKLSRLVQEKPIAIDEEAVETNDIDALNDVVNDIEARIIDAFKQKGEIDALINNLQENKTELMAAIRALDDEKSSLQTEKKQLLNDYKILFSEKQSLEAVHTRDRESLRSLETELKTIKEKYEALVSESNKQEEKTIETVKQNYGSFMQIARTYREKLKSMWKARNELEDVINKVKRRWLDLEARTYCLTETKHKQLYEKRETLAVVFDNFIKEYFKITKNLYNANSLLAQIAETSAEQILSDGANINGDPFKQINLADIVEKLDNCKDVIVHFHEQLQDFDACFEKFTSSKVTKTQKENVDPQQNGDVLAKDEEWRKKYSALKQRLFLTDSTKSMFEKKLKQLREENKRLTEKTALIDNDNLYGNLLKEYKQYKKENDEKIEEYEKRYVALSKEFEEFKQRHKSERTEQQQQKVQAKGDDEKLKSLRDAYAAVLSENSRLDMENGALTKKLEDTNKQIRNLSQIKLAYEKLLEDHDRLRMDVDLIKFNSAKEMDQLKKQMRDERETLSKTFDKQKMQINTDWEHKFEKIKDNMTRLFKEEMECEIMKRVKETDRNEYLLTTIEELKEDLKDARTKIQRAESERDRALEDLRHGLNSGHPSKKDLFGSRESISSMKSLRTLAASDEIDSLRNELPTRDKSTKTSSSILDFKQPIDRRYLSRNGSLAVINENKQTVATSVTDLPKDSISQNVISMEDEGDMFNNKYLNDLQSGICTLPRMGRESTSSRMSELAWRNSLVPPHLKSSYPAETQFSDPRRFKDEDLKAGNVDLNDSMSLKLLPHEKPRKKDFGTTSYKRPGPPTPSKNGGRPSLQEHEVFSLHNESKTPKKNTPGRLKSLFKKRNSAANGDAMPTATVSTTENLSTTPKARRLSFFRKH